MARKNGRKNAVRLEKKSTDIFPPLGVPLCTLAFQNVSFGRQGKSKGTLKK